MLCIGIIFKYRFHIVYLIKMKVVTTISYKKHFELYTEILDLIVVNSCQLGLAKKIHITIRYSCDTL